MPYWALPLAFGLVGAVAVTVILVRLVPEELERRRRLERQRQASERRGEMVAVRARSTGGTELGESTAREPGQRNWAYEVRRRQGAGRGARGGEEDSAPLLSAANAQNVLGVSDSDVEPSPALDLGPLPSTSPCSSREQSPVGLFFGSGSVTPSDPSRPSTVPLLSPAPLNPPERLIDVSEGETSPTFSVPTHPATTLSYILSPSLAADEAKEQDPPAETTSKPPLDFEVDDEDGWVRSPTLSAHSSAGSDEGWTKLGDVSSDEEAEAQAKKATRGWAAVKAATTEPRAPVGLGLVVPK
ncbi:hypothetical protein JCM21900_004370 [Sporobolomyces salmonicolor]